MSPQTPLARRVRSHVTAEHIRIAQMTYTSSDPCGQLLALNDAIRCTANVSCSYAEVQTSAYEVEEMSQSSDMQGRGYILAATVSFLRETAGNARADEILQSLSPELQQAVRTVQPADMYPIRLFSEINRALVTHLAEGDEEKAKQILLKCGRHMGREASNTFLKLLMRMLTPKLIMKKLPDFWRRDFTGGRIEVSSRENGLELFMHEIDGYDHCCPLSAGWQEFNLEAMGKTLQTTTIRNWSLANPSQDGTSFEIIWKA
jgi:hypothetical protein